MRFSIIIPVYNVADYLETCVRSVLANRYTDLEVLLIDDGSTDGKSGELCDKLARENPRFLRVIHQKNRGLGGARNTGLEEARGDYVFFVDSDDYIAENALQILSKEIDRTNADVYSFQAIQDNGAGKRIPIQVSDLHEGVFTLEEAPDFLLSLPAAWARIWRRELFAANEIRFPERVWYEDIRTTTKLLAAANGIVTLPDALYFYLAREGSIMRNVNVARNREILDAFDDVLDWYSRHGLRRTFARELERLAIDHILIAASVRVACADRTAPLLGDLRAYMERVFPDYPSNPYLRRLPRNKRLAYRLVRKRRFRTLALLFKLKNREKKAAERQPKEQKAKNGGWLRWVLFALGAGATLWFLAPPLGGVVTGIGLLGVAVCLAFTLACLFWPKCKAVLAKLWKKKPLRPLLSLLAFVLAASVLLTGVLMGLVVSGMRTTADDCDVLIVLGCQVNGDRPSLLLNRRIDAAERWLTDHPDTVCIVSGGKGSGENVSEAACMANELISRGIDPARIYSEDQSTSTAENLRFSKALMAREGLSGSVAIVSNNFHLFRARLIAEREGLAVETVSARAAWYSQLTFVFREAVAIVYFWVSGK